MDVDRIPGFREDKFGDSPMQAARQKQKRKGRSVINRERTVTTLTEGESALFVSTPSDDPLVSSPFSVSSSAGPNMSPGFQMPNNFAAFPYNGYMAPMPAPNYAPQHDHQQFFHRPPGPPSAQNDLEVLEKLKETIKNGQHEFFRAVPQPAALANLYMGPRSSRVPPHPEQIPTDHQHMPMEVDGSGPHSDKGAGNGPINGSRSTTTSPRLSDRARQGSDAWTGPRMPAPPPSVSESETTNKPAQSPRQPAPRAVSRFDSTNTEAASDGNSRINPPETIKSVGPGVPSTPPESAKQVEASNVRTDDTRQVLPGYQVNDQQSVGRTPSDKTLVSESQTAVKNEILSPSKPAYDGKGDARPLPRENSWSHRNGLDEKSRYEQERPGPPNSRYERDSRFGNSNGGDNRGPGPSPRLYEREKERERDYERERDRSRDWERDRDRRPEYSRAPFREDRRIDDRSRVPPDTRRPIEQRPYDSRSYEHRSGDPVSSSPRMMPPRDRHPSTELRQHRSLGEERAIIRPHIESTPSRSLPDDRRPVVPPPSDERSFKPAPGDDRRGNPPPLADRILRDTDDRRAPPPVVAAADRSTRPSDDRKLPTLSDPDRPPRPVDDRRPPVTPPSSSERIIRQPDDRRPPPPSPGMGDRHVRPVDRPPIPLPPSTNDRQIRPAGIDDRRPPVTPPASSDRLHRPPVDDRRLLPPPPADRLRQPVDDRRSLHPPPVQSESRGAPSIRATTDAPALRPPFEERGGFRPAVKEESTRTISLEERISRAPSLQERLSTSSSRSDDRRSQLPPLVDERSSRPPSLEERLSRPAPSPDDRAIRPHADERSSRAPAPPPPTIASDRPSRFGPGSSDDRKMLLAEPVRPPLAAPADRPTRPEERGRPPERFAHPAPPAVGGPDRGPPPRTTYPSSRTSSLAREESRVFKPRTPPARSPARPDIREFRPAADPSPRERADYRPPYRPEQERYPNDRRPDLMQVDPPSPRLSASYRRPPSPPPAGGDTYASRPRTWVPPNDAYPDGSDRRPPSDTRDYSREWREDGRGFADDWEARRRTWDRTNAHDYNQERYVEREPVPNNGWETREERERRVSSTFPPPTTVDPAPATQRSYDRPLSSRLTDVYANDDRGYPRDLERGRYPVNDTAPSFSRVRPRSPSPVRRPGAVDDLRPPVKRARDDTYGPGYYSSATGGVDVPRAGPGTEYPPPLRRSPLPVSSAPYYDDHAPPYAAGSGSSALPRERDYDPRDRTPDVGRYPPYDRRGEPPSRAPPPRSPPPFNRFRGDDRRYNIPPRP